MTATPHFHWDFQGIDHKGRALLDWLGFDAERTAQGVVLGDGMRILLYDEDEDRQGKSVLMVVDAVVRYDEAHRRWVAEQDMETFRYAPLPEPRWLPNTASLVHRPNPFQLSSEMIDSSDVEVMACAKSLARGRGWESDVETARACFDFVRDHIRHSSDHKCGPVTCRASDVLRHATGYCYAKSHLLAALLRANGIPAGFCYQRLAVGDKGPPFCLHGFNAVYLRDHGWYRIDARGNKPGVHAEFTPPVERLAFTPVSPEEVEFEEILAEPHAVVVASLRRHEQWDALLADLPDIPPERWGEHGLSVRKFA